ncbi:hypothetical protein QQZ08_007220 [Neonectria magnoliae]|uniref:Uncharacterized protein n=1 Tax=Neonectria magnoliae TaxID=2732573 RepID=A0ABR1HZR2_9HYPO
MEGTSFVGEVESIGDLLFQATISYAIRFTDPFGALNLTVAGCLGALQAIVGSSSTGITAGPNDGSTGIAISAANTASNAVAKAEKTDKEFTLRIQELEAKLDERDKTIDTLQGQLERHSRILRKASEKFTESEVRIEKSPVEKAKKRPAPADQSAPASKKGKSMPMQKKPYQPQDDDLDDLFP